MEGFRESGFGEMRPHLFQSSVITKPQGKLDVPVFSATQMAAPMRSPSPHNLSSENGGKRAGMPPSHPNNPGSMSYSQITGSRSNSQQAASPNMKQGPSHSRSLSQPTFFSLDSLPPLSPFSYHEPSVTSLSDPISTDGSMEEKAANSVGGSFPSPVGGGNEFRGGESLPPRKGHRRSNSDTGFSAVMRSSSHLSPVGNVTGLDKFVSGRENLGMERPVQLVKRESEWSNDRFNNREGMCDRKSDGEAMDDLFSAYMNLDNIDALNSSGTEDKDLDSRASGSKTNGGETSDNEVESRANGYPIGTQGTSSDMTKREGVKRRAGTDIAPTVRHYRSVSMDSYMENLQFDDESLKLPLSGKQGGQQSPANSVDASISKVSFEIRSGEFTTAELKKIMENEKLAEIASVDPKRAKRILANRQSAARSKERKMRYISELEHKVQTLQTEATTLSAQVTMLQRDFAGATTENNELKFRVQALEQQARLKDALNEALVSELQRLKLLVGEVSGDSYLSNCLAQQLSISSRISQLQYEQAQLDRLQQHQLQNQQPQQQAPQHQSTQLQTQQPNDDFTSSE